MRKPLLFMLICAMYSCYGQRQELKGIILNTLEIPQSGITVFNETTMGGTVTTNAGEFSIKVKPDDRIIFQALQYEPFTLIVTEETLKQESITIQLREGVNMLDEVRITDSLMLVNVEQIPDVNKTLENSNLAVNSIPQIDRMENTFSDRIRQPDEYPIRNLAAEQSAPRFNFVNIVGLLLALVDQVVPLDFSYTAKRETVIERFNEEMLQNNYSTTELVEFLGIPEEDLSKFLYFASESGLSNDLLAPERELDLLQYLSDQAKVYKSKKSQKLLTPANQ